MWFEQVSNWVDKVFNMPLPIVGVSLGIVCITALKILKSSSFGKKIINKAQARMSEIEKEFEEKKLQVQEISNKLKSECDSKIEALETYYETCLAQKQAKEDELETLVLNMCDNIHNEKIKKALVEYKNKIESHQTIMTMKINEIKASYDERIKALEEKLNEKEINNCSTKE